MSAEKISEVDLLNELSGAEDDFDVDLMACGCRLASGGISHLAIPDLLRLYNFDQKGLEAFIGALIDEGNIDSARCLDLAEKAARGLIKEKPSRFDAKKKA